MWCPGTPGGFSDSAARVFCVQVPGVAAVAPLPAMVLPVM